MSSIKEHGFYRNVVAARDGTILAGHGVVEAARRLGLEEVPTITLEIEPDSTQAKKILAGDNTLGLFAEDNDRFLADLLKELSLEEALPGTGFDEQMLAAFALCTRPASEIADKNEAAEWLGMPEHQSEERIRLVLTFDTTEERAELIEGLGLRPKESGHQGTLSARFPDRPQHDETSVRFEG